ncbi:MAG: excinuclease ABC subunit UvrB [Holosporales bacterium]|jgi:excinuclease ABC subunit B|nr:excinuclease ABC subunit UvrB [Holosporales bacterium]
MFSLTSSFAASGDQPAAIKALIEGVSQGKRDQVLLGVTGSGKTFTMAQVIYALNRPTLILAPNKTLAAQLYGEMKDFFPQNAVEYFVSYYDYYQPEAYVPRTDTYIEKEATINEHIDRMRHAATRSLLERRDVIIVASVSCIYGIGDQEAYRTTTLTLEKGQIYQRNKLLDRLVELQYTRNDTALNRGQFRVLGDIIEIYPAHAEGFTWRLSLFDDEVEAIWEVNVLTGQKRVSLTTAKLYANKHFVTTAERLPKIVADIQHDLAVRYQELKNENKLIEAQRLQERVSLDLEMLQATGHCQGIENYSRYLTGRSPGDPPPTLFEYLPSDALLIVDESHVAVPQLGGMYRGDRIRKTTLATYGFRLPSCVDNRPLKFEEWNALRPQTIFVSATPGPWELQCTQGECVEQIIRPTGLVDPPCIVQPSEGQIDDLLERIRIVTTKGYRVLVTTLTKKMAEALTEYVSEIGVRARYLHSDIETLERIALIQDLRRGEFDVLIGINLLREGLDIPECGLVAILDADKEGFLRSKTSLIQIIGRAARNIDGYVVLYADTHPSSLEAALEETQRRRDKQLSYNATHKITPVTIKKVVKAILEQDKVGASEDNRDAIALKKAKQQTSHSIRESRVLNREILLLEKAMYKAAQDLDFEQAAALRDRIHLLRK